MNNTTPETPNATTLDAMESAEKGEDIFGPFEDIESLMQELNK